MLSKDTSTLYNTRKPVREVGEGNGLEPKWGGNGVAMSSKGGCTNSVCVSVGDAASLTKVEIREALVKVKRSEAKLACWKSELLAELNRRFSAVDAQQVAADELMLSNRDAKKVVDNAAQLEKLPNTKQSLAAGDIDPKQAAMITASSTQGPVDEKQLSDLAKTQNADDFGRSIREHQKQQDQKGGLSQFERQRKRRSTNVFDDPITGMLNLHASFDPITGARVMAALTAKEKQLWHNEDIKNRCTPQQRRADALAALICEQGNPQGTNLIVIADVDTVKQQLVNARLINNTPINDDELRKIAVKANVLPAIFNARTQNLMLGHKQRSASNAQRIALTIRDQHCIGCKANPLWCRAHHIKYWSHGGATNLNNLALVCDRCHHKIHDQHWQVTQNQKTRKYQLIPPPKTPYQTPQRK